VVGLPLTTWLSAGLVFLAVALGTVSVALLWEFWREQRRKKSSLRELRALARDGLEGSSPEASSLFRRFEGGEFSRLREYAERLPHLQDIELMLQQAGMSWTIQTYILLAVGLGAGFGLATLTLTQSLRIALLAAVFGGALPYLVVRRKRNKRLNKFEEQLPETIDLLGRAIRAGHPLSSGLKMIADEAYEPVAGEFRRSFEEQRFGLPLEDSLMAMADRVGLVDVRILTTAILIQRNVGGNLAEILDNLAYTIRERFKIRRQLRVYTAQGRISGYVLGLLPIVLGCVFYLLNPAYIMTLFLDPAGHIALTVAVILQLLGFLWIRKIINIEI
jgi:tight adherence protein B